MSIQRILVNVTDVQRSIDFYTRFLDLQVLGTPTADHAQLDAVTAVIDFVRVDDPSESTWDGDDLQRGFRHIGFKVAEVDPMVEALTAAAVPFHLEPIDAEGGVRITFFFDPDGTLLELVQGPLQYHETLDEDQVQADWGLGTPERPRFDHVAVTVEDIDATRRFYDAFGFTAFGIIHQPSDPRGYEITYLRGGDTVLEVFTYDRAEKRLRDPQLDAPGFVAAVLTAPTGDVTDARPVGDALDGTLVQVDPDGFPFAIAD